ncbi:MAG: hypothetical protein HZC01_02705 [Candidatus Kerfeldbacteria bacterium]|nr:hypothetical protein [Candidatus Kerfeldbacteria bacterium]
MKRSEQQKTAHRILTIRQLMVVTVVTLVLVTSFVFSVTLFADSEQTVTLTQVIDPHLQFQTVSDLSVSVEDSTVPDTRYIIAAPASSAVPPSNADIPTTGPVVNFQGTVAFPDAPVIIELSSLKIRGQTVSDHFGNWSWSNYGAPLDVGEHHIRVHTLVTTDDATTVYVEQYTFLVTAMSIDTAAALLDLNEVLSTGEAAAIADSTVNFSESVDEAMILFDAELINPPLRYQPEQELLLGMTVSPVQLSRALPMELTYSIHDAAQSADAEPLYRNTEETTLQVSGQYLEKSFWLGENVTPGRYVLSIQARIGNVIYLVNKPFTIEPKFLATVGGEQVPIGEANRIVMLNMIIVLLLVSLILALIANEYRRFFIHQPIDESLLASRGYFRYTQK